MVFPKFVCKQLPQLENLDCGLVTTPLLHMLIVIAPNMVPLAVSRVRVDMPPSTRSSAEQSGELRSREFFEIQSLSEAVQQQKLQCSIVEYVQG